ncbi:MAG: STAS domain-containing protein [Gammaproteobacteria bacterium]|nr:STAS domain-containing protein [Gammaproteobacteria bacterium]
MNYDISESDGYIIASLCGDMDLASFPQTREAILASLDKGDLLVDLSAVDYLDSSGVASLVEGFQISKSKARRFGLLSVSRSALNVIQLAHLDKVFPIYSDLREALNAN